MGRLLSNLGDESTAALLIPDGEVVRDDVTGDGDGLFEQGETLELDLGLRNPDAGSAPVTGISGVLTVASGDATIVDGASTYPDLAGGARSDGAPYRVRLGTPACGSDVVLTHTVTSSAGTFSYPVTIRVDEASTEHASADVPKPVPPSGTSGTTTSSHTITGADAITDLDVELTISHTYDDDLDISLTSPAGTTIDLSSDNGLHGHNYSGTRFDDEAPTSITTGVAPFSGSFRPEQPLSSFDGEDPDGTWTLTVFDDSLQDLGTLDAWSLHVATASDSCAADLPAVSVSDESGAEGDAGTSPMVFDVTLSAPATDTTTVEYGTVDGTATTGDYTATSGTLAFAAGEQSKTVTVPVVGDTAIEPDETFTLTLSNPSAGLALGDASGTGTIENDDVRTVSIADASATEADSGTTGMTFDVTLSHPADGPTTVDVDTSDGTATAPGDFTATSTTVTFGTGESAKTVTVPIVGDTVSEPTEQFTVQLSNPSGTTIGDGSATGTIDDDDAAPTVSVAGGSAPESSPASFTVTLSNPSQDAVSVDYATQNGTAGAADFSATSGTLTFLPGQVSLPVPVPVTQDALDENDETFKLVLTNPSGATVGTTIAPWKIVDDDPKPGVTINDVNVTEGNSGTKALTFTIKLSKASGRTVTVSYKTANGSATAPGDYAAKSGTVTFQPGQTTKTVAISVKGDTRREPNETMFLLLSGSTNGSIADGSGTGGIIDND